MSIYDRRMFLYRARQAPPVFYSIIFNADRGKSGFSSALSSGVGFSFINPRLSGNGPAVAEDPDPARSPAALFAFIRRFYVFHYGTEVPTISGWSFSGIIKLPDLSDRFNMDQYRMMLILQVSNKAGKFRLHPKNSGWPFTAMDLFICSKASGGCIPHRMSRLRMRITE